MELKDYDLRTVLILPVAWGILAVETICNDFYRYDLTCVGAAFILGFLYFLLVFLYNGPLYRYQINEVGISISCFRGTIGFVPWTDIATVGIAHLGKTDALYFSILSPSQLSELLSPYKCPQHVCPKFTANPILWKNGVCEINEKHPIVFLKSQSPGHSEQDLKRLLEQNYKNVDKYGTLPVSVYSFPK